jgi:hypothetical protein
MRESGYYWVKTRGTWWMAQYLGLNKIWLLFGSDNIAKDKDFEEIDERQIKRDESKNA